MAYKLCLGNPLSTLSLQIELTLVINKNTNLFGNGCKTFSILSTFDWMDQNFLQHLVARTHSQSWKEKIMQELKWRPPLFSPSKHRFSPSCNIKYISILFTHWCIRLSPTIDKHLWIKHKLCKMWYQHRSTWNMQYNQHKIDVKCVRNNKHKSIYNMIHIDNTHACIYIQWTYLEVRYLDIQNLCICTLSTLPFMHKQVHKPKTYVGDYKSWTEWYFYNISE